MQFCQSDDKGSEGLRELNLLPIRAKVVDQTTNKGLIHKEELSIVALPECLTKDRQNGFIVWFQLWSKIVK